MQGALKVWLVKYYCHYHDFRIPYWYFYAVEFGVLSDVSFQLAEALYEFGRSNYERSLELFGSNFDAIHFKVLTWALLLR